MNKTTNNYFIDGWNKFSNRPPIHKILIGFYATLGGTILVTMLALGTRAWAIYNLPSKFDNVSNTVNGLVIRESNRRIDSTKNHDKIENMATEVHEIHDYIFPKNKPQ